MIETVVALLMFVNGSINEARIQESMATCLRGKRQAERQYSESVSYKCYTGSAEIRIMKNCNKCKKEFEPKDELDMFCSQDCKEEALADLDNDSDECLSCQ
jgi:hypothetical protein